MNEQPSVELLVKLTDKEINLWRLANGKANADEEAKRASWLMIKSIRERNGRYTVRELGGYNAAVPQKEK
jgi:hypothetical protein